MFSPSIVSTWRYPSSARSAKSVPRATPHCVMFASLTSSSSSGRSRRSTERPPSRTKFSHPSVSILMTSTLVAA